MLNTADSENPTARTGVSNDENLRTLTIQGLRFLFAFSSDQIQVIDVEENETISVPSAFAASALTDSGLVEVFWRKINDELPSPLATIDERASTGLQFNEGWDEAKLRRLMLAIQLTWIADNPDASFSTVIASGVKGQPSFSEGDDDTPKELAERINSIVIASGINGVYREALDGKSSRRADWLSLPYTLEMSTDAAAALSNTDRVELALELAAELSKLGYPILY